MTVRTLFIAAGLAAFAAPVAAAGPSATVMAPIEAVIAATNTGDLSKLNSYFTPDAVVVDEFAPYRWSGPNAGVRWWTGAEKFAAKGHVAKMRAAAQAVKFYGASGNEAYVVVPLVLTFTMDAKPERETGLATFTLRRSVGTWKISTLTWATATNTM